MQESLEQLRNHLTRALNAAEQAEERRNEFLSSVAHEIRTPTASILGYVEMLIDETGDELSSTHREYLSIIHRSGEHISRLIDDLLRLEELASRDADLELEAVDIVDLVREVRSEMFPIARKHDLELTSSAPKDLPPARAHRSRLRQVLVNLASNALKFTEEGSVAIEAARATMPSGDDNARNAVCISVRDTGIGIHPEFRSHLFERFSREKRTEHVGSGLGLTISKELIEQMGGEIEVESTVGEGSRFSVYLPAADES